MLVAVSAKQLEVEVNTMRDQYSDDDWDTVTDESSDDLDTMYERAIPEEYLADRFAARQDARMKGERTRRGRLFDFPVTARRPGDPADPEDWDELESYRLGDICPDTIERLLDSDLEGAEGEADWNSLFHGAATLL